MSFLYHKFRTKMGNDSVHIRELPSQLYKIQGGTEVKRVSLCSGVRLQIQRTQCTASQDWMQLRRL